MRFLNRLLLPSMLLIAINIQSPDAKNRAIILTDISPPEQEPDDMESMVRLLLYSNELDIAGLVATSSCWRKSDPLRADLITSIVNAYGKVQPNLLLHDAGYPAEEKLLSVIREGNGHGVAATGAGKSTPGSDLIISTLANNDPRPLWICVWGGAATLAQALIDLKESHSGDEMASLMQKLRVYDLSGQDDAGAWICHEFPGIFYIRSQYQWRGFSYRLDNQWNESRGGDESFLAPEWFKANISNGHGPLGALYPAGKYLHEGDTPTFLNLLDNGLSTDPDSIAFGGWGGRFEPVMQKNIRTGSDNSSVTESQYDDYFMFTDATDTWNDGSKSYSNIYCPVFRWRTAVQHDFAARMDWCTATADNGNHHPKLIINGDSMTQALRINVTCGCLVTLDAGMSYDPDSDSLVFNWYHYPEAGTYEGTVAVIGEPGRTFSFSMPGDIGKSSIHIICEVHDNGNPALYRYRRIIVSGKEETAVSGERIIQPAKQQITNSEFYSLNGRKVCNPGLGSSMVLVLKRGVLNRSFSILK